MFIEMNERVNACLLVVTGLLGEREAQQTKEKNEHCSGKLYDDNDNAV